MVDVNRMTHKVEEDLQSAGGIATRRSHQRSDVEHLLLALLEQREGGWLRRHAWARDGLAGALRQVRDNQRVTPLDPEARFQASEEDVRDHADLAARWRCLPYSGRE